MGINKAVYQKGAVLVSKGESLNLQLQGDKFVSSPRKDHLRKGQDPGPADEDHPFKLEILPSLALDRNIGPVL